VIRLLIADRDRRVRRSLRDLLADGVELTVVGESGSATEAITMTRWLRPDVVLFDASLADGSPVEACIAIHAGVPTARVLILGLYDDVDLRTRVLAAGAHAYIVKDLDLTRLQEAILGAPVGG
jgi:DNA-binding NarL/FixJ family response regulator